MTSMALFIITVFVWQMWGIAEILWRAYKQDHGREGRVADAIILILRVAFVAWGASLL